jgi:hypothetical protein
LNIYLTLVRRKYKQINKLRLTGDIFYIRKALEAVKAIEAIEAKEAAVAFKPLMQLNPLKPSARIQDKGWL